MSSDDLIQLCKKDPGAVVSYVVDLQDKIKKLEAQLSKDSHNSSKPPSSDNPFQKGKDKNETKDDSKNDTDKARRTNSLRRKSNKKSGGQEGHPGKTLEQVSKPDKVEIAKICKCGKCGKNLEQQEPNRIEKRQMFDIKPIERKVTEFQSEVKECDCGHTNIAEFPEGIKSKTQYGPYLGALAVYFSNYQLIPLERSAEIFEEIFRIPLSQGTLVNINERSSNKLSGFDSFVKNKLTEQDVLGHDESGMNINGKLHWLHVCSSDYFTYYSPHDKRGREAFDAIGILPNFSGSLIHDHWKPYFSYECSHFLCNSHHLRELTFIYETYSQKWAQNMIDLLLEIKDAVDVSKSEGILIDKCRIKKFSAKYSRIVREGFKANPPPEEPKVKRRGRKKKSKSLNLLERLRNCKKMVLGFMYNSLIPFDNNQAERDIRMVKVKQKISGLFRSYKGAVSFCRIRSFISTVRKQNLNVLDQLHKLLAGENIHNQFI